MLDTQILATAIEMQCVCKKGFHFNAIHYHAVVNYTMLCGCYVVEQANSLKLIDLNIFKYIHDFTFIKTIGRNYITNYP